MESRPFYNGLLLLLYYINRISFLKIWRFSAVFSGTAGRIDLKFGQDVHPEAYFGTKHFFAILSCGSKMADHFHFLSSIFRISASKSHLSVHISKTALTMELFLGSNDPYNWMV